ncbi:MAG: ABC transporter substrate-binding protein [Candidatus Omnitrophica bacterium]|nr:ABC transporter substrate-binding protein [Candidatus Omnitrophota bacterium]
MLFRCKALFGFTLAALLGAAGAHAAEIELDTVKGIEIGKPGGRIIVAALGEPKTFNPISANETSSTDILAHIYDGLLGYNPEKKVIEPALAASWEHSEDYLTWTFHLRRGVQWNDGAPFTADDVIFSASVIYDEKIINPARSFLEVKGERFKFIKKDDRTVEVRLPAVFGPFERAIATAVTVIPKHKLEADWKAGRFAEALNIDTPPKDVVGTGPFMIGSYLSGERVVLVRNPHYWRQDEKGHRLPYLDEIVFLNVPDLDAMDVAFEAGKTDVHDPLPPDKFKRFKGGEQKGNYTVHDLGGDLGESHFWFNQNTGSNPDTGKPYVPPHKLAWFTNRKFRIAVSHCVNREGIARNVFRGRAQPLYSPISPADKVWHNPDIPRFEYDLDKAKALLDELQYIDRNGDGIREDPQGRKIEFLFITNRENDIRERMGAILQESFQQVGIDGRMKLVDFNTLVTAIADSFDYEACLLGLTGSDNPLNGLNVFRSSARTHSWFPNQKTPATEWEAKVDQLIEQYLATPELPDQVKIWHEIQRLYGENQPMAWLVNPNVYVAVRNKFGNMRPQVIRPRALWNREEIFVK